MKSSSKKSPNDRENNQGRLHLDVYISHLCFSCSLKFITWTSTSMTESDQLCVMPPDLALKLAQHLGFDSLEYKTISAVEAEKHMLQVKITNQDCINSLHYIVQNEK